MKSCGWGNLPSPASPELGTRVAKAVLFGKRCLGCELPRILFGSLAELREHEKSCVQRSEQ